MNINMNKTVLKYLLFLMPLVPVAKNANARTNVDYRLDNGSNHALSVKGGIEYILPSASINSQLGAKDLDGACMGGFVELGLQNWSYRYGALGDEYETHIGYMGRLEFQSFNSRAFNVIAEQNASGIAGNIANPGNIYKDPESMGFATVRDYIGSLNVNAGIGAKGVTLESNLGLGWHFDNQGNIGPVFVIGGGLGARVTKNLQLALMYRMNVMPFENPGPKKRPSNNPGMRSTAELNFTYRVPELKTTRVK